MLNNEPVAWMDKETGQVSRVACYEIPLYTHPADLTDEEILEIAKQYFNENLHYGLNFARAILKKASEK